MQPVASARHTAILLGILTLIAFGGYTANRRRTPSTTPTSPVPVYAAVLVGQLLLVRYTAVGLKGMTIRELVGREFTWVDVPVAAALWFGTRLLLQLLRHALGGADSRVGGLLPHSIAEKALWVALSITAGICEEIVYRGYLQRQFSAWTRSVAAGIALQAVIFGVSHAYQDVKSMLLIIVYGALFGIVAWWRRSLRAGMMAHAWTDIYGGLT